MENPDQVNQDVAAWVADVVQIKVLAAKRPISESSADRIVESAGRLLDILEGRLSPELQKRLVEIAERMTGELAVASVEG